MNAGNQVKLLIGAGDGTFTFGSPVVVGYTPSSARTADFDGDGDLDLVTAGSSSTANVFLNDGRAAFALGASVSLPAVANSEVSTGDLDGDGMVDFVVPVGFDRLPGRMVVVRNTTIPAFARRVAVAAGQLVIGIDFGNRETAGPSPAAASLAAGDALRTTILRHAATALPVARAPRIAVDALATAPSAPTRRREVRPAVGRTGPPVVALLARRRAAGGVSLPAGTLADAALADESIGTPARRRMARPPRTTIPSANEIGQQQSPRAASE
jgi:hypothetical protein